MQAEAVYLKSMAQWAGLITRFDSSLIFCRVLAIQSSRFPFVYNKWPNR